MLKRSLQELRMCPLFGWKEEKNSHIILDCTYRQQVWKELVYFRDRPLNWVGQSIEVLRLWHQNPLAHGFLALPYLVNSF